MEQMEAEPGTSEGPMRSQYRGLSWDKKYQGWRVRIYYSGKQRHVGRFEDELLAARAYDKAAVCLYGTSAITNFGLEACLQDPTEVCSFILQAKEKADQEQQSRAAQHPPKHSYRPGLVGGLSAAQLQAVLQHGVVMATASQQAQQLYQVQQAQPQQQQQQQQILLPVLTSQGMQQQLLVAGGYSVAHVGSITFADADRLQQQQQLVGSSSNGLQQQQQQMQLSALPGDGSSYVLMSSPLIIADSLSSMSCLNSTLSSSNSTASSYMLCSTPSGQTPVLPVASPAVSGMSSGSGDVSLLLQPQQQQQQVQQQQVQQQQQPQLLLVSATGEPLQLSVQPEMITIAGHLSAAAAAAPAAPSNGAQLLSDTPGLQQLQDLSMLNTMLRCSLGYNNILQDWQLAGQQQQQTGGSSTRTAAATVAVGSPMPHAVLAGSFT